MIYDYLDRLPCTHEEKEEIARLGATNPASLLSMLRANPGAFERFLGTHSAKRLEESLDRLLEDEERTILSTPIERYHVGGAIIDQNPPSLRPPAYDIEERDHLFEELQQLKHKDAPSPEIKRQISEIEGRLSAMFESE